MVTFEKIRKVEGFRDGHLIWKYTASAWLDGKTLGYVSDDSEEGCQKQVDYWLANPDEFISKQMSNGKL